MKKFSGILTVIAILLISCKRETVPSVETLGPVILNATTVLLNGKVVNEGNSPLLARGFCWSQLPKPSLSDSSCTGGTGTGAFEASIETLPETTYYVRAYATNLIGTAYGQEQTFTTPGFEGGTFTDSRDSKEYSWVIIGTQNWMAENLAYIPAVSPPAEGGYPEPFYYVLGYEGHDVAEAVASENYQHYGVLYNWKASQTACPEGWHLPSDENWKVLELFLAMNESEADETGDRISGSVGRKLKSRSDWLENGNGINNHGFNALPGGGRNKSGAFGSLGVVANFWTSTPGGSSNDFYRGLTNTSDGIIRQVASHNVGLSVRCIMN